MAPWTKTIGTRISARRSCSPEAGQFRLDVASLTTLRLAELYALDRILTAAATMEAAIPTVLNTLGETEGWEVGVLWQVSNHALRCLGFWHHDSLDVHAFEDLTRRTKFPPANGLPGRAWEESRAVWVSDIAADHHYPRSA